MNGNKKLKKKLNSFFESSNIKNNFMNEALNHFLQSNLSLIQNNNKKK